MSQEQQDAGRGMEAARKAIMAIADDDEAAALAVLNTTTHGEALWAVSYLLSALRESMQARYGSRWREELREAASDPEDAVMTQVRLIVKDAVERGDLDE